MSDLTIVYYTSNYLEEKNPYFLANTKKQLIKAANGLPIVSVSHKPVELDYENHENIVLGDIGRSHLNIYRQILIGCKNAKTKYVAMAEDDILYSPEHFNFKQWIKPEIYEDQVFMYDMAKVSLFTWGKPIFSFRTKRRVVNQLIAHRDMLIDSLEERFKKLEQLLADGRTEESIIKYWGDPGRYEGLLGVTARKTYEYYSWVPSVVFSHEYAYGYEFNQGKKKKHGDLRIVELCDWGRAEDVLRLYNDPVAWDELFGR